MNNEAANLHQHAVDNNMTSESFYSIGGGQVKFSGADPRGKKHLSQSVDYAYGMPEIHGVVPNASKY